MYLNEKLTEAFTYLIASKTSRGEYKQETRRFNDRKHFENWYDLVTSNGVNIIGLFPTKDSIEHVSEKLTDEQFITIAALEHRNCKEYEIFRTALGDYIKYKIDNLCSNIIMFRNNQLTIWIDSNQQQSFINFTKIENYLTCQH